MKDLDLMVYDYLADLNQEQRRAVKHGAKDGSALDAGPLLVIAGAGSGKTKTLAHRVAHLVVNGIDPHRILLLTFSRRAALDMTGRVRRITGAAMGTGHINLPWAGTFHAIGARILREYAPRIGLKPSFTILDRSDAADLIDVVRHDLGLSKQESRFPRKDTCLAIYSFVINSGATIKATLRDQFPWCIEWEADLRRLFREYTAAKQRQNVLDYDDLLLCWAEMMNDADLAAELGDRFDNVLVDEFQDTNRLQAQILLKLKPNGTRVTVVGDDAQAIYSFRAATVRNILDFPDQFDPSARIITLEQNYRSTQPILEACNAVIGFAKERFTKHLRSDRIIVGQVRCDKGLAGPSNWDWFLVKWDQHMKDEHDYAEIVDELHDAALAVNAAPDIVVNALLNVAVEVAIAVYGQERGRKLLEDILRRHFRDAAEQGVGEPGYYEPKH